MATQTHELEIFTQVSNTEDSIEFQVSKGVSNGTDYDVVESIKTIMPILYPVFYNQVSEKVFLPEISVEISSEIKWNGEAKSPADVYDAIRTSRGY